MAWNDSLEALKGLVADAAQAAARVTKSAAAVTKSNINLLTEQDKLKKAYQELGKLYYRDFITGEEPDDAEYLPLCDAITEATKAIEALRGELEEAKASFAKPAREEAPAEPADLEAELADLDKELDNLDKELDNLGAELNKVEETAEQAKEIVIEVVEDLTEPTAEEAPKPEE